MKENLEAFTAPRASFALNSLPALAKCTKLRRLDLSLVATPIPFKDLKKSLTNLSDLRVLLLPSSTTIADSESVAIPWPPRLSRVQFSGHFSPEPMRSFRWPPALTSLTIQNCSDLSLTNLSCLLCSPDLNRTLKRLTISGLNRRLSPESITSILALVPALSFLSIPGDMVESTFLELLCHIGIPTLEVLEFGHPNLDPTLYFTTEGLQKAIEFGLPNLYAVGIAEMFISGDGMIDDDSIDELLLKRAETRKSHPAAGNTEMTKRTLSIPPGVYYV